MGWTLQTGGSTKWKVANLRHFSQVTFEQQWLNSQKNENISALLPSYVICFLGPGPFSWVWLVLIPSWRRSRVWPLSHPRHGRIAVSGTCQVMGIYCKLVLGLWLSTEACRAQYRLRWGLATKAPKAENASPFLNLCFTHLLICSNTYTHTMHTHALAKEGHRKKKTQKNTLSI